MIGEGMTLAVGGIGIGIGLALGLSSVLAAFVYKVRASSPAILVLAAIALMAISLIGALMPALRATRTDPMMALRAEG